MAVNAGAVVIATTRRRERFDLLKRFGAKDVKIESPDLIDEFTASKSNNNEDFKFDKTLNLIGNSVLLQSISLTRPGGRMLQAGWLGGLDPVKDFNPMLQMESGVHFSLFHSKVLGGHGFPMAKVGLQEVVKKIENGEFEAKPSHVFGFGEIRKAHELLDSHDAGGKIVVVHE